MGPSDIEQLRGPRTRAEFAALVGVTPLTVYRWELPESAPEARRPRGKVLARLRALGGAPVAPALPPPSVSEPSALGAEELAAFAQAFAALDGSQLDRAELELVSLLSAGTLRSAAARTLASALLARVQLLARHDTKSAFGTLLAGAGDLSGLPRRVQLEYHLTAAFLHAHSDAQLFSPGKTNHHAALAEQLISDDDCDRRFFLWYAQFFSASSLYDIALVARAVERLAAMRELATTDLHRCLAAEAETMATLSATSADEALRRIDQFAALAAERALPLQQLRSAIWRAEVSVEEATPPAQILALLERGEELLARHRIAGGMHVMLMRRNTGETLLRLGQHERAEKVLLDAARVARDIAYTPIRIFTTLARLYLQTDRIDAISQLAREALVAEDAQCDITRTFGRVLTVLCDVLRGDASADWCEQLVRLLDELRRLGVWPVAYRHLALLSLAVGASRASARDAERLVRVAERAVEMFASATATAALRRHRAIVLMRRGKLVEARQALEAALATLLASGDVAEAALVRCALANLDQLDGAAGADARLAQSEAELARLGIRCPALVERDAVYDEEPACVVVCAPDETRVERLVVPLERLATRGVGCSFLARELVTIAGELFGDRPVVLDELDGEGRATRLGQRHGDPSTPLAWFQLSDGWGRRFRLGVGAPLDPQQRAMAEVMVTTAGLAFEVAALRAQGIPARRSQAVQPESEPAVLAGFVAASPAMRRLKTELQRLSSSRSTIIITGESGTGKEVIARAIHELSRRATHPYLTFNSAAVPRDLFEGQLFGHKKGAFTGATSDQLGVIRSAEGGTLFLDEIGELPMDVQPKLLRFLENGEVMPLGGREPIKVDVRVITATHRDLCALMREGKFREDLYYRLQVVPVEIPPLRERREDVLALARHFIRKITPEGEDPPALASDGEARLLAHGWPGNVRELRNVIERSMAFDPLPRVIGAAELRL